MQKYKPKNYERMWFDIAAVGCLLVRNGTDKKDFR